MPTAMTIDVLPARFGDCLFIECHRDGDRPWRMVVDGGPADCWPALRDRLLLLPTGDRNVDLAIVTHIDADHIGGALALFDVGDKEVPGLQIGEVWFNGFAHLPDPNTGLTRSTAQGESLANLLGGNRTDIDASRWAAKLPWNAAFDDDAVMTPENGSFIEREIPAGPRLTVLSPTYKRLAILRTHWQAAIDRLNRGESDEPPVPEPPLAPLDDLVKVAARPSSPDRSKANGSSIVVLLEHRGASCLLAADGFANVVGAALKGLALARGTSTLTVDAFKLPHHGSRANITQTLIGLVPATHYIVSTNSDAFHHPDDEALARVVTGAGGSDRTLWFNYRTDRTERWADPELQQRYCFRTRFPEPGSAGIVMELPARQIPMPADPVVAGGAV